MASLDNLLNADRQRRKNEALATELLGKGRRSNTLSNGIRKPRGGASLASRIGVTKRSVSTTPNPRLNRDLPSANGDQRPYSTRLARDNLKKNRLYDSLTATDRQPTTNGRSDTQESTEEINIRGSASGPFTVCGENFAPGTTAADIESAMFPSGGEMLDCRIVSTSPTVVAEMVVSEKSKAESIIATFNNKRADGRILYVYLKQGKITTGSGVPPPNAPSEPKANRDVTHQDPLYNQQREQSDRNRRRAEPEFQDGRYGFESKEDQMDVDMEDQRGSYRDRQKTYGRGRDVGRPRDDRRLYSDDLYSRPVGRSIR